LLWVWDEEIEGSGPYGLVPVAFWATAVPIIEGPDAMAVTVSHAAVSTDECTMTAADGVPVAVTQGTTHGGLIAYSPRPEGQASLLDWYQPNCLIRCQLLSRS
jgi:hypothetical protein